jgi:hypothetical protein
MNHFFLYFGVGLDFATELLNLNSGVEVNFLRCADQTNLNTKYRRYERNAKHPVLERLQFPGNFSYIKDETLESELKETGPVTDFG